jgi:hypothetical protein
MAAVAWQEFAAAAPDLAAPVRARFQATKHHVLATLRLGGSPRVSGTEVQFHGPDLTIGSMPDSAKGRDLRRDGRFALHANPGDGSMDGGDAKVAGSAVEVTDPAALAHYAEVFAHDHDGQAPPEFELFRLTVSEVVHTSLHPDGDRLVIRTWRPDQGLRSVDRY